MAEKDNVKKDAAAERAEKGENSKNSPFAVVENAAMAGRRLVCMGEVFSPDESGRARLPKAVAKFLAANFGGAWKIVG